MKVSSGVLIKAKKRWFNISFSTVIMVCILASMQSCDKPVPKQPNLVLIISDQHQAGSIGCYGSNVKTVKGHSPTPQIDQLALSGVKFTNAYTPAPLCAPARASLMSGVYPHKHTALHHKYRDTEPGHYRFPGLLPSLTTIGQVFRENGYKTAAIGKMHVHGELKGENDLGFDRVDMRFYTGYPGAHYSDRDSGDWYKRYRELPPYNNMRYSEIDSIRFANVPRDLTVSDNDSYQNRNNLPTLVEYENQMMDFITADSSISFINTCASKDQPFFIHVGFEKPHEPYNAHKRFMDLFNPDDVTLPNNWDVVSKRGPYPYIMDWLVRHEPNEKIARNTTASYYAAAAEMDEQVGKVIEACKRAGIYDNTIFIYTTDHGENLYHHSLLQKHNMFESAVKIPLILSYSNILPKNFTCPSLVSLLDVLPTITKLCGIDTPTSFEGTDLLKVLSDEKENAQRMVFSEFYEANGNYRMFPKANSLPMRMCRYKNYKYIYTHGLIEQLYNLQDDPEEMSNLVLNSPFKDDTILNRLRAETLNGWTVDSFPLLNANVFVDDAHVKLTWDTTSCVKEYLIYKSKTKAIRDAALFGKTTEPVFIDSLNLQDPMIYYWVFGVLQLNRAMEESVYYNGVPVATEILPDRLPATLPLKVSLEQRGNYSFNYQKQGIYE